MTNLPLKDSKIIIYHIEDKHGDSRKFSVLFWDESEIDMQAFAQDLKGFLESQFHHVTLKNIL